VPPKRNRSVVLSLILFLALFLQAPAAAAAADCAPSFLGSSVNQRLTTLFTTYGNDNTRHDDWTGADGTYSVRLPSGRELWVFSDTFLGQVNPDGSRPPVVEEGGTTVFINNSFAVERDGRLRTITTNLQRLRADLLNAGSTYLQPLRDSEFLSAIKHRSAIPGGTCEFDLPDYFYWLNRPAEERMRTFSEWLGMLRPLCDAIAELLWLTRQNGRTREEIARAGAFHITFDRDTPYQLLRISLPASAGLYPEISGSHYRCSVRFLTWNGISARPTQAEGDVPFLLSCCT